MMHSLLQWCADRAKLLAWCACGRVMGCVVQLGRSRGLCFGGGGGGGGGAGGRAHWAMSRQAVRMQTHMSAVVSGLRCAQLQSH